MLFGYPMQFAGADKPKLAFVRCDRGDTGASQAHNSPSFRGSHCSLSSGQGALSTLLIQSDAKRRDIAV